MYTIFLFPTPDLQVHLDIRHFMPRTCRSLYERNPIPAVWGLHGLYLSSSIFKWHTGDFDLLMVAKREEMVRAAIPNPFESAIKKAISKEELTGHCRRQTRGVEKTVES